MPSDCSDALAGGAPVGGLSKLNARVADRASADLILADNANIIPLDPRLLDCDAAASDIKWPVDICRRADDNAEEMIR
jgi:hypothetical protein